MAQRRFTLGAVRLPVDTQRFGQPIERAFRRRHVSQQVKEFFPLLGGEVRHHPGGLLGGQRCPGAFDDPGTQFQRTDRMPPLWVPIQTPLNPHGTCRTGRGRFAPQDAMATCPVDLDRRHIEIEAGQFATQRFTLGGNKVPMQLLFKRVEILHGLVRFTTLTQKVMQLIHGVGITGQEVTGLQCLHGGSPLG